jgi:hypothetical protein
MKDWNSIARASGLGIPDEEIARITVPLVALEETFRPLVQRLTPDIEPYVAIIPERLD